MIRSLSSLRRFISKALVWGGLSALPVVAAPLFTGGPLDSTSFLLGGILCQIFSEPQMPFVLSATGMRGSVIHDVNQGLVDLAILPEIWVDRFSHHNEHDFTNIRIRGVAHLGDMDLVVLVRAQSPMKDLNDLKEKTILVASSTQGADDLLSLLVNEEKPSPTKGSVIQNKPLSQESLHAFCEGKIDAVAILDLTPNEHVYRVLASCPVKPLKIPPSLMNKMTQKYSSLHKSTLSKNAYDGLKKPLDVLSSRAVVISTPAFPAPVLEKALLNLRKHFDLFKKAHPSLSHLTFEALFKGLSIPVHQGSRNMLEHLPAIEKKEKEDADKKKKDQEEQKKAEEEKKKEEAKNPFGRPGGFNAFGSPPGPFGASSGFNPFEMQHPSKTPIMGHEPANTWGMPHPTVHVGEFEEEATLPAPPPPPGKSQSDTTLPPPPEPKSA